MCNADVDNDDNASDNDDDDENGMRWYNEILWQLCFVFFAMLDILFLHVLVFAAAVKALFINSKNQGIYSMILS